MSDQSGSAAPSTPEPPAHTSHHGNTPAAWALVAIVLVGFVLGAIAMMAGPDWVLFWVAVGVVVVGLIVGKVMQMAGMGVKRA